MEFEGLEQYVHAEVTYNRVSSFYLPFVHWIVVDTVMVPFEVDTI